jgi:hypothetical protein
MHQNQNRIIQWDTTKCDENLLYTQKMHSTFRHIYYFYIYMTVTRDYVQANYQITFQLHLQLQSGYLVTSASRHLTKDYIYTRAQQSLKV